MKELKLSIEDTFNQGDMFNTVPNMYLFFKRAFDILLSASAILILFPLLIILASIIKIESKGPVFFIQVRHGDKGKKFKMYKFRSMVENAEQMLKDLECKNEVSGHMFKMKIDPRVTKVGRVIRKTSIDELPQLLNILKGDMSIVGPRPPIISEVVKYNAWQKQRLSVKPGLTGLWQVSGRNDVGFEEMVRLDLKYIRERSFWYDIKLILKTVPVLLGDNKAF